MRINRSSFNRALAFLLFLSIASLLLILLGQRDQPSWVTSWLLPSSQPPSKPIDLSHQESFPSSSPPPSSSIFTSSSSPPPSSLLSTSTESLSLLLAPHSTTPLTGFLAPASNPTMSRPSTGGDGAIGTTGSASQQGLNQFIKDAKGFALSHLSTSSNPERITFIMGNEAGDLDSAVCAISLSYLLTHYGPPAPYNLPKTTYVPLIQSNHDDASLRPENTAAYKASGIDPSDLLCLDDLTGKLGLDLTSSKFSPSNNIFLGLVDHPALGGQWGGPNSAQRKVELIVDHHEDDGHHQDATMRIIRSPSKDPVGSASSLVAELFKDQIQKDPTKVDRRIFDFLISAIILDTDNLRPAPKGKATRQDFDSVLLMMPHSSFYDPVASKGVEQVALSNSPLTALDLTDSSSLSSPDDASADPDVATARSALNKYWQILAKSKLKVNHLSGRDLLRRDYKEVEFFEPDPSSSSSSSSSVVGGSTSNQISLKLGFSSVPISLEEWLHRGRPSLLEVPDAQKEMESNWKGWWNVLDEWMSSRKIQIAVVTGTYRAPPHDKDAGKHKRELVIALRQPDSGLLSKDPVRSRTLWEELRKGLEEDAHVQDATDVDRRLMLEKPWKGQRLPEALGGKRERVQGLDGEGLRLDTIQEERKVWAGVYRQGNARANRKVVLPAVVQILRNSCRKLI
ncbi:DHH phosphoesterase [Violaceomyces palustris]|uniref:DHH phosphoesterase n=1 Tax=Violaceomyces palustris TaxID=1673888 RepID=A0ACD0NNW5_9BASI|nr:DHH phosphoesterase [Violaceomyces palustris]